jgi:4a-hydroxytetrahydrobiopterin dehydratase
MLKARSKGVEGYLHHPGGSESIAYRSVGHAHHVDALRQALKQGWDGTAHVDLFGSDMCVDARSQYHFSGCLIRAPADIGSKQMTEALASKTCTPCRGGVPPLTREQAETFHVQASDWQLPDEAHHIERSFRFRNFREALTFVQEIGELAEAEGHHPNINFGWGNVTVSLQTKKIHGLHENDFIMAAKIDRIFARTAAA